MALGYLCKNIPLWVKSDDLTVLGFAGAIITCLGDWLGRVHPHFLWVAVGGLVLNWFGDSLDGTIARYRRAERPQYGFFIDHTVDGFAMAFVAVGFGLSPMAHLDVALFALICYYLVVISTLTTCLATGVFQVSFGGVGPTEVRLGIIACTASAAVLPIPHSVVMGGEITLYDVIIASFAVGLLVTVITHSAKTARTLAKIDPPRY
ncbi:CDP-alcohol phosphatidyltransferase family protein [Novosphingobium nitrogenifigens]|uniref:CDP-alcohol phosphatidyltransferase family protein n=1 Tax=Novosphingobium nitrogenifigens TaxID=378548 RepID=UPI0012F4C6FE|nr:CDP-alcohol phosphatidyltransferase family protein [Novosphingobium nitrogenifigens]